MGARFGQRVAAALAVVVLAAAGCGDDGEGGVAAPTQDDLVRLNQVQVLGSHNSYHIQPKEPLFSALIEFTEAFRGIEYTHLPLDQQFANQGIRQIELDVFADPEGGLYSVRKVNALFMQDVNAGIPALLEPGFKVLHIQEVDFETTCYTFVECLQTIKAWSDANPNHLPIMVLVELKDEPIPDPLMLGFVTPLPIGPAELDALDAEIRSVFPPAQLITPDDVRGTSTTLEQAVLSGGWPTLREARGRILFCMDNGGGARRDYLDGHPNLQGRVLFTNANPGDPDAAFVKRNDPIGDLDIADLVAAGYIVRTRADGDTEQARTGDTTQRDAAINSGAQYVSTDYPVPNPAFGTGYFVEIPGDGIARCNPLNAPPDCVDALLE